MCDDDGSADPGDPVNPVVIDGIGGASSGIAFDQAGNLFTGNGFEGAGPSGTGAIKAFDEAAWMAAWTGGTPLDFENEGTLVIDILSADTLGFDADGNLHVGGGETGVHSDFAALVAGTAIAAALGGQGPVDAEDSSVVRRFDPDSAIDFNFYAVGRNAVADELYIREFAGSTVYVYPAAGVPVPAASSWGLFCLLLVILTVGTLVLRNSGVPQPAHCSVLSGREKRCAHRSVRHV